MNYLLQCLIGSLVAIAGLLLCMLIILSVAILVWGSLFFSGLIIIVMAIPKEEVVSIKKRIHRNKIKGSK